MPSSGTLTGSFNGTSGSHFTLRCKWTVNSQDSANLTSNVTFVWAVRKDWSYRTFKNPASCSQNIAGASASGSVNFDISASLVNTDYDYWTKTVNIPHNADGTKVASVSGTLDLSGTSAGVGTLSGSITLPTIAVTPPTINSFVCADDGTGVSTVGVYVANKSRIQLTATATANNTGATIASYSFYANDELLQSGSSNVYTGANLARAGSYVFKVVVADSYGVTNESSLASITVHSYSVPTITATETFRCDSGGNADPSGTYVSVKASWSIASVGTNSATCVAQVSGLTQNLTQNTASTMGGSLSTTQAYTIQYTLTDAFGETATKNDTIYTAFRNFNLHPDGGFAFGEMATANAGVFNVAGCEFRGGVVVDGQLSTQTDATVAGNLTTYGDADLQGALSFGSLIVGNWAHEYYDTSSNTSTSATETTKTWTANGAGIVIASVSVQTDTTSNYGNTEASIQKGSTLYAYDMNRFGSANASKFGAHASAAFVVQNGDVITLGGYSTKNGTKTYYYNAVSIGCTLS